MAGTAIFLASRAGAYVTGAVIPVDGGIATTEVTGVTLEPWLTISPGSMRSSTTCSPRTTRSRPTSSRSAARSTTAASAWVHFPEGFGGLGPRATRAAAHRDAACARRARRRRRRRSSSTSTSRRRRWSRTAATSCATARCARCSPAKTCGASCSPSPARVPTSPGLSTRCVRDGDEWIANGQKVWNTLAHLANKGMLVARTDPELPEAQGPHLLHGRHARAGRGSAAAAPDHRRGRVQRGVPHRRAHPRRRPHRRRRRRLARLDDHADERAHHDRRRAPAARSAAAARSRRRSTRGTTRPTTPPPAATS